MGCRAQPPKSRSARPPAVTVHPQHPALAVGHPGRSRRERRSRVPASAGPSEAPARRLRGARGRFFVRDSAARPASRRPEFARGAKRGARRAAPGDAQRRASSHRPQRWHSGQTARACSRPQLQRVNSSGDRAAASGRRASFSKTRLEPRQQLVGKDAPSARRRAAPARRRTQDRVARFGSGAAASAASCAAPP